MLGVHRVQCETNQRRLDHRAVGECRVEVGRIEVDEPVPQGEIRRRGLLSLQGDDSAKLTGYFNGLAAGGKVDMPLAKQFWGDTFGMLTDRFGVHWMVNISAS